MISHTLNLYKHEFDALGPKHDTRVWCRCTWRERSVSIRSSMAYWTDDERFRSLETFANLLFRISDSELVFLFILFFFGACTTNDASLRHTDSSMFLCMFHTDFNVSKLDFETLKKIKKYLKKKIWWSHEV